MTDEELKRYKKLRVDNGLADVSDAEAMKESTTWKRK
jgi:hypothetical protein